MVKKMENLRQKKRINVSIAVFFIWFFCITLYFIFINLVKIPIIYSIIILISETILCLSIWLFFFIKIDWLKDINTGKEITYLNISNILSSIRFSLVPLLITMFGLLVSSDGLFKFRIIIFIFAILVCLTDLFDGMLARNLNQVTRLGMILDPMGDFLMIICFSILIYVNNIIEWWFFLLIMIRIPGLVLAALFLMTLKYKIKIKTNFLGRATIFYTLIELGLSTIKLFLNLNNPYYNIFLFITQIIGGILLIISITEKIVQLVDNLNNQDKITQINAQF